MTRSPTAGLLTVAVVALLAALVTPVADASPVGPGGREEALTGWVFLFWGWIGPMIDGGHWGWYANPLQALALLLLAAASVRKQGGRRAGRVGAIGVGLAVAAGILALDGLTIVGMAYYANEGGVTHHVSGLRIGAFLWVISHWSAAAAWLPVLRGPTPAA